jgi:GNAT superfamily N-acetyltransferase
VKLRTYQAGDEAVQVSIFNEAAAALPGFKPATQADVEKRTRAEGFDPMTRFYAEDGGKVVGYCTLEPDQGRISFPWCKPGSEAAAPQLLEAATQEARKRGITKLFAAYRRDWEPVLGFLKAQGFAHARDMINYWLPPGESVTVVNPALSNLEELKPEDMPAIAAMGRGVLRIPAEKLEAYFFNNPHFSPKAVRVLRLRGSTTPIAIGIGIENSTFADVRKVDPLAPCFRMGAYGTEGLNTKRVNGLFSFLVAAPERTITAGLALLDAISLDLTDGSVDSLAAQCPSDVKHLVGFYTRYFKEHGRFPILEKQLS